MISAIALLVAIFALLWGSTVVVSYLRRDLWNRQVTAGDDETVARLQDEVDELRQRLDGVEELVRFDRQLAPRVEDQDDD